MNVKRRRVPRGGPLCTYIYTHTGSVRPGVRGFSVVGTNNLKSERTDRRLHEIKVGQHKIFYNN